MADLYHYWGGDLGASATGDILPVSGSDMELQRVLRRLMTNPGEYVFHPEYGGGLGQFVGADVTSDQVAAVILAQLKLESVVAANPAPVVTVNIQANGTLTCQIQYNDATTNSPQVLAFDVTE